MSKINLLENLKKNDSITLNVEVSSWQEAIYEGCRVLIEKKLITKDYYNAIIESTLKNGPYYIISDNLAMPHAQMNRGVFDNCFSLVTLKKPIFFEGDSRPVRILITLAATSAEIHTSEALPRIVAIFEDPANIEKIMNAQNKEEIIDLISKIDFTKYIF
ncbi:PTS sugar transporter subunit IIA [Mycoplasmopsis pulmonis]|uniref:PTS sugar transporter subunit IIA n=1 Tax=Mycoplasmopsis pulmonis TaxID=2107 RepID=UPI0010050799|nr:PTS sugar transporter subunit IIA [Mycoplasmopsis pulmonis]VEU68357.1 ascorbate-specific PTS system enzyme II Ccomponent [Mycoplasmopsis pulmonis]